MSIEVPHHGLFTDGSISWLIQDQKGTNFLGLRGECPVYTKQKHCNHRIPVTAPLPDPVQWDFFREFAGDPAVAAFFPIPKRMGAKPLLIIDEDGSANMVLNCLSRLSSPIRPIVRLAWTVDIKDLEKELGATNVQPFVVLGVTDQHTKILDRIAQLAPLSPRQVIMTGSAGLLKRATVERVTSDVARLDLDRIMVLPLENIGATLLRRHARHEDLLGPIESREARRQRMLDERST